MRASVVMALLFVAAGCEQPRPYCTIAQGDFAASLALQSSAGPCAQLEGIVLQVQSYNAPLPNRDNRLDPQRPTLAFQLQEVTELLAAAPDSANTTLPAYAFGEFAQPQPNDQELCDVTRTADAGVLLAEQEQPDGGTRPALTIRYRLENVQVKVTPTALGTELTAELDYMRNDCRARYRVHAIYPATSCVGSDGATPDLDPAATDDTAPADCAAASSPSELPLRCETSLGLCVVQPSL